MKDAQEFKQYVFEALQSGLKNSYNQKNYFKNYKSVVEKLNAVKVEDIEILNPLANFPSVLSARISFLNPTYGEELMSKSPVVAQIKGDDGEQLYIVLSLFDLEQTDAHIFNDVWQCLEFNDHTKPIIFDDKKNMYVWKKGLFGYKLARP